LSTADDREIPDCLADGRRPIFGRIADVLLFAAFVASVVLIGAGGLIIAAGGSLRPAGAALIGLGVLLLVLAVISTASYNAS
jgi:hypothetical protein